MTTPKPYTHRTFIAFCRSHGLTFFKGHFGYQIRQWPLSQFIFKFEDNRITVNHCPITLTSYTYEAQSFSECLAKISYHQPSNLFDLIQQFPWQTVTQIISSSQKIGTTNFLENFSQRYGYLLPSGKQATLTKYISERSTSAQPRSLASNSPTTVTFHPTSSAQTQVCPRKKQRACSVRSAKPTQRTYPPPTL